MFPGYDVGMTTNLDRYKKDLGALITKGHDLRLAIYRECDRGDFMKALAKLGDGAEEIQKRIPSFNQSYQPWYSEAKALVRQLLPDRLEDFVGYYEKPRSRKEITHSTYTIADYLDGVSVKLTRGAWTEKIVGPESAVTKFDQQLSILESVNRRFESCLFDIRQLVQADLFDSELEAAEELVRHKFLRAAGALAGVVLERHLGQVCVDHKISLSKKAPTIADLNDALKDAAVVDIATWRFVQHLGDIRNLCDHNKNIEPTPDQVKDLVSGVQKVTKTIF